MITIPLYIFLFAYLLFLAVFAVLMIVNVYHFVSTDSLTVVSFVITLAVGAMALIVLYLTWYFLQGIDWKEPLRLFSSVGIQPF